MPKKLFFCLYLFALLFGRSYAQVSLQTGSAVFSLPMFNWQDNKSRLTSMVALTYNSGNGLKVNDVASNVGQGWSLVAGGVIARMQVGEPDDQVAFNGNGDHSEHDITKYPAGILYASTPAVNGCPAALTKYPIYRSMNQVYVQHNAVAEDKQFDYFSFQFNGKSGMFVLNPANMGTAKIIGDTKMKVTFQTDATMINQGIRTSITSFAIQDVDGLIYHFSIHGVTKVLQANYCDAHLSQMQTQPKFKGDHVYHQAGFDNGNLANPWIIGTWYLSQIEDALTHRTINFNYVTRSVNTTAGEDITYNSDKDYTIISHKTSVSQSPEISSIIYPDGHYVVFNYGNARYDMNGEYVLSSVDISYQGRYISKYLLNQSYFILNRYGIPSSPYQQKVSRLCLRSVQKIGVDLKEDSPPYIFDYYTGSNTSDDFVPPPFFYAKDIWGFYNGSNSKGYWNENIPLDATTSQFINNQLKGLCFLNHYISGVVLNAKPGYAKNGLLRQIIYPTGGTLTYQYDQNTGVLNGSSTPVGGVHVSQTSSTDGGYSNGCSNPLTTSYNYLLSDGVSSSLWGLEMPVNWLTISNHYQPEYRSYHWTWSCAPFGCCYWHFQYPGILSQQQSIDLTKFQQIMNVLSPILGIVSVVTTIMDAVTVFTGGSPVALIIDVIGGLINIALTCFGDQSRDSAATIYYNSDLNGIAPLPTQFKRVEIVENPGTIGKTVQEFTSADDYPLWEPANPAFSAKQRFAPWAYGLPKASTIYDASGNMVKQTMNFYSFGELSCNHNRGEAQLCPPKAKAPLQLKSAKCLVTHNTSQRNTDWASPSFYNDPNSYHTSSYSDITVDIYDLYTGRVELDSTIEKLFKTGDPSQFVSTMTNYSYNSLYNYEPNQITTTESNGDITFKFIKYSTDYTGGALTTLVQNNIVTLPVETITAINKYGAGLPLQVLNEQVTEYVQLSNGDIKPSRTLEQRFSQPVSINSVTFYQGPGSPTTNYKIPKTFTYDGSANLVGVKDEGNRQVTSIYDYIDKCIVATVVNADPLLDNPAYSSFESYGFGGWALTGIGPVYVSNSGITGSRAFNLASNTFSRTLNTLKPYTLSFWANNGNVIVTGGATLVKSSPTINGFTYYEYDIAQGTSSVSVSGSSLIDELRIYPKTARMSTVTYDQLIGKTSECDVNNRITYYEYDNLGRLRFIKDDHMNIVKMYEYNNISVVKQNGCPGLYYNHLITETFTRNNCGSGYLGGDVTVSVPANTYSSSLSQEDADAQAQAYLLTYGQSTANNSGTCILLYYNTQQSQTFTSECEGDGYIGGAVTYTVPAGTYYSTVSQADADQMALDDIEANGQAYANSPAHANCATDYNPHWVADDGAPTQCQTVNGEGHLFMWATDVNPNSSSYGQSSWQDLGPDASCPSGGGYVTMVGENDSGYDQYVEMTNTVTGETFFFAMPPWSAMEILGSVPAGTYNIQIYDNYGYLIWVYSAGCNNYYGGAGAFFYNVWIDESCNTILIHF